MTELRELTANAKGQIEAISKAQAVIEFSLDGAGHHGQRQFPQDAWATALTRSRASITACSSTPTIGRAENTACSGKSSAEGNMTPASISASPKAAGKSGSKRATIRSCDDNGRAYKVVEYATDITEQKLANANFEGQIAAINRAQAVIEFGLDGRVLTANENFLKSTGLCAGRDPRPASQHVRRCGLPAIARLSRVLGSAGPRRIRCRPV